MKPCKNWELHKSLSSSIVHEYACMFKKVKEGEIANETKLVSYI